MSNLGVVDPMRVPAPLAGLIAQLRALPQIAQAFIVIAVVDAIVRTIGLIEPRVITDGYGWLTSYLPRDAWILLPAVALARRPTLPVDMPWAYRGVVAVGHVTLLAHPTASLVGNAIAADSIEPHLALAVLENVAIGLGFAVLGLGLRRIAPTDPRPVVAGLANLGAIIVVLAYAGQLFASLWLNATNDLYRSPAWWEYGGAAFGGLCVAYLVRGIGLGLDDPSRPEPATRVATAGALIWAVGLFAEGLLDVIGTVTRTVYSAETTIAFGLLQVVGPLLVVIAFGIGLADPLRPMAKDWETAAAPA